jgi:hypothetical protein
MGAYIFLNLADTIILMVGDVPVDSETCMLV